MEPFETPLESSYFYKLRDWYQTETGIAINIQGATVHFTCNNTRNFDISKPLKMILEIPYVK